MLKIFIVHRRTDWAITQSLEQEICRIADVETFADYSGTDRADFDMGKRAQLQSSDVVLVILTESTFAAQYIHRTDDQVRREIKAALDADKPIIFARVDGILPPQPGDLPVDILQVTQKQGIPLYAEYFDEASQQLVQFLSKSVSASVGKLASSVEPSRLVSQAEPGKQPPVTPTPPVENTPRAEPAPSRVLETPPTVTVSKPGAVEGMSYLDFEIEIGAGNGREYPVVVLHSPAGEARETMRFPFDELALESHLKDLQIALLRSGGSRRQLLSDEEHTVQDFGKALFEALLGGKIRARYDVSREKAVEQDKGLRFKLRIQSPELAALPWEFMFDPDQGEYVCLSKQTPLVRYIELSQPIQVLTVAAPLRILGMVASPNNLPELDVEREKQRIEKALAGLQTAGLVELVWASGQTWRDLQAMMRRGPWNIFHFVGHGGFDRHAEEGIIALVDDDGSAHRFTATQLGRLLADHHHLRLAILNACEGAKSGSRDIFSSVAATLVRRGVPAVLAMQYEITDACSIEFSRTFYETLADGLPVETATAEARVAISIAIQNTVEWGTPVLYMRSADGVLFNVQKRQ